MEAVPSLLWQLLSTELWICPTTKVAKCDLGYWFDHLTLLVRLIYYQHAFYYSVEQMENGLTYFYLYTIVYVSWASPRPHIPVFLLISVCM
jgi:hypothetical protein